MGIPTCRFVNQKLIEEFNCSICDDVADNPVVFNGCEDIFCLSCIGKGGNLFSCPSCQVPVSSVKPWKKIDGFLKRCYLDLEIMCLNPTCDHVLNVANYKNHDDNCPFTFKKCDDCGHKRRRFEDSNHSCVKGLKDDYNKKLKDLKNGIEITCIVFLWLLAAIVTVLWCRSDAGDSKLEHHFEKENQELKNKLIEIHDQLMTERIRYENLIATSLAFRNEFDNHTDYETWRMKVFVSRNQNAKSVKALNKLTTEIDYFMNDQKKPGN